VLGNFVDRADIRMIESRSRPSLAAESFDGGMVAGKVSREKFQRDPAAKREVFREYTIPIPPLPNRDRMR
jgi:hypothetical protein